MININSNPARGYAKKQWVKGSLIARRQAARDWLTLPPDVQSTTPRPVVYKNPRRNERSYENIARYLALSAESRTLFPDNAALRQKYYFQQAALMRGGARAY